MTTALITGITGQDGSYLAELLLGKGYVVHGVVRRSSSFNTDRIDHVFDELKLHHGDVLDVSCLSGIVAEVEPDEVYHLAAQSHVAVSFETPGYTSDVITTGTLNVLEAVKLHKRDARVYLAGTSEMFGSSPPPQDESTPMIPRSPYAAAKLHAFHMGRMYREAYGLFVANGILFNHESPRRGETFLTRKVTRAVARIKAGRQKTLALGHLHAKRDWGWAPDYVDGMWRMLQHTVPDDFVLATGSSMTVRDWVELAFDHAGLPDWDRHVTFDDRYVRPAEVDDLCGDASKAREVLGWEPTWYPSDVCRLMVEHDLEET